ncbi:lysozyme-like [Periplaneta americana]|uniref:lysozyme-like n=1 Tax=Periplaneta americana TaxID=6978 RepID=UPI0037E81757
MKCYLAILLAIVVVTSHTSQAKPFTECQFLAELRKHHFKDLRNWLCLAKSESSLRSHVVGGPNKDNSYDYGIFQINSRYWCAKGEKGGDCNIRCEDLINDNIGDDIKCVQKIYKRHGFKAWYGWQKKCQKTLPALPKC